MLLAVLRTTAGPPRFGTRPVLDPLILDATHEPRSRRLPGAELGRVRGLGNSVSDQRALVGERPQFD